MLFARRGLSFQRDQESIDGGQVLVGLTAQNSYRSPERRIPFWARRMPSAVFYLRMLKVVWQASRIARQGAYTGEKWIQSSMDIVAALESVGIRIEIDNLNEIQELKSPCIFVGNHMSVLETFVLPCLIQPFRNVTFVVKQSLISYPLFKHILLSRDPIVVGRSDPRRDLKHVLEEGLRRLERQISIIIFPQTTRSAVFDEKKFNSLGVKVAERGKVPVVPFALKTDAWGVGRKLKDFGRIAPEMPVRFAFGKPLTAFGNSRATQREVVHFIRGKLDEWGHRPLGALEPGSSALPSSRVGEH
jgi:1-acyl-sn-glycerol-3-phosphate acyltransferase